MGVTGIGGLFFRAKDPDALSVWYREHLGIGAGCVGDPGATPDDFSWVTAAGPVVFAPFKADTDYFAAGKAFMLNLRVEGIDELLGKLRSAGIEVVTKDEWNDPGIGRFARVHDPEGNQIELWEPPA